MLHGIIIVSHFYTVLGIVIIIIIIIIVVVFSYPWGNDPRG